MNCEDCGVQIPPLRMEACPDTRWCVKCSDKHTDRLMGFMIYPHKTGGEVIMTSGSENFRKLEREYKRSR